MGTTTFHVDWTYANDSTEFEYCDDIDLPDYFVFSGNDDEDEWDSVIAEFIGKKHHINPDCIEVGGYGPTEGYDCYVCEHEDEDA